MVKTMYALQDKGRFFFSCSSPAVEGFEAKVNTAYNNWRGMQPRGSDVTKDKFLEKYNRVKVTVEAM
jgi:hypothetical protein